jgi:hypothetical protein
LNTEIDTHFRKIMTKDYWAELSENYTLRIRKHVSSGEDDTNPTKVDVALSTARADGDIVGLHCKPGGFGQAPVRDSNDPQGCRGLGLSGSDRFAIWLA